MKTCITCKVSKPFSEFHRLKQMKDGYRNQCRDCRNLYIKAYYKRTPRVKQQKRETLVRAQERNRAFIREYLSTHPCVDCKEDRWVVLEFDHVRGKKLHSVCDMVNRSNSLESIKKEISKCEVRCANCHRLKTAKQFGYWRETGATSHSVQRSQSNRDDKNP